MTKYTLEELYKIRDAVIATLLCMTRNTVAYSEALENENTMYKATAELQELCELVEKEIKSRTQH